MKKIALRDWHNAIVHIYEAPDDYDTSILEQIHDTIHGEESDGDDDSIYAQFTFDGLILTDENINTMDKTTLDGYYDGYFGF